MTLPRRSEGPMREHRSRGSVVETLVALLLTLFLLVILADLAARFRKGGGVLTRRMEVMEARRITRDLLSLGIEGGGVRADGPPSELRLRSFVGTGLPCGDGAWGYVGRRLPDPARDSVWVVGVGGEVRVGVLLSVGPGECAVPGAGRPLKVGEDTGTPRPALLRVFEPGRFRVGDAVRYGRLGSSPQPLTEAALDPLESGLVRTGDAVVVHLRGRGDSAAVRRRWWLW